MEDPELRKAYNDFDNGDYEASIPVIERFAEEGDPGAQTFLGTVYATGEGMEKDLEKANDWFSAAAMQGYADAEFNLGLDYYEGNGAEKDIDNALDLFARAAEHGYPMGKVYVAIILSDRDPDRADGLLAELDRSDDAAVLSRLGLFYYESGRYPRAAIVLRKAAEAGEPFSQYLLGTMYADRLGVEKNDREARKWLGKALKNGVPEAAGVMNGLH